MSVDPKTIDLGNGETKSRGVFEVPDGWLAMTFAESKTFTTKRGAEKWFARKVDL